MKVFEINMYLEINPKINNVLHPLIIAQITLFQSQANFF